MTLVKKTLRDFALWTSASGIPHVGRARSPCMRVFWLIIFIVCMISFAYQMVALVEQYMSFDVLVETELKFEPVAFPVITICNLNPYKASAVKTRPDLNDLMTKYLRSADHALSESEDTYSLLKVNDTMAQQSKARDIMKYMVSTYNQDDLASVTYDVTDLIKTCTFNQQPCPANHSLFAELYDPTYGRCYTYNTTEASKRAGPHYGLRLFIITNLTDYLDTTESAGARLTITNKNEPIYPDAFGYNARAGFTTSFAMKYVRTTRLPYPFSSCYEKSISEYSAETCFRRCMQDHIIETCKCVDPHFSGNSSVGHCTWKDLDCVNSATRSGNGATFEAKQCDCPPLCDEGVYSVTTTSSNWPSKAYQRILCNTPGGTSDCQYYHDNTMFVEIYFEALNYEVLTESQAYTLTSLISDFGGQIGLWIGVSVITCAEFLLFPFLLCSSIYKSKVRGATADYKVDAYDRMQNEFDRIGGGRSDSDSKVVVFNHYGWSAFPARTNPYAGVIINDPRPPKPHF